MTAQNAQRRTMLASCDSVRQGRTWVDLGSEAAIAEVIGDLRLVRLLDSDVVVTYAQLLDGIVLLELGPAGVARALGTDQRRMPFTVSAPEGGLAAASASIERPGFRSSALDALTATGMSTADAHARLTVLRAAWVAVSEHHPSMVESLPGLRAVSGYLASDAEVSAAAESLVTDLRTVSRRSEAWTRIDDALLPKADEESVRSWWSDAYDAMLADQHGAALLAVKANKHRRAAGSQHVSFVEGTAEGLRRMPPAVFEAVAFQVAQLAKRPRRAALTTASGTRAISYVVRRACDPPDRASDRTAALLRIAILVSLGALIALGDLTGGGAVGIAVLAGFAQGLPWSDIVTLMKLWSDRTGRVVYLKEHGT